MAGGLGWHYRAKIADKLGLVAQKPSDASLLAFNNEKFEVLNDSLIVADCDSAVSILFLGNSLTPKRLRLRVNSAKVMIVAAK